MTLLLMAANVKEIAAQTSATVITGLSPTSMTISTQTDVTLTSSGNGMASGDKIGFIASGGSCTAADANIAITFGTSGSSTVTVPATGTGSISATGTGYITCYQSNGQTDGVAQTSQTMDFIAATGATVITAISPTSATSGTGTSITLTGTIAAGDLIIWATSCTGAVPNVDPTDGTNAATSFTVTGAGTYKLCLRVSGGSDSVEQTGITLTVSAAGAGSDPVARFGDTVREFELPHHKLVPLVKSPHMVLHASVFPGNPYEQWFGRMVLTAPDESRFLEIKLKDDLEHFNMSKVPRGEFGTLDITMGYGSISKPLAVSKVTRFDHKIPFHFLGQHILARRMQRHHNIRFSTIGRMPRECLDMAGESVHLYICTSPADEYYGELSNLALRYAHLDLAIVEVKNYDELTGVLPELWGTKPMSETTRSYVKKENKPSKEFTKMESTSQTAWAGGLGTSLEDLTKGCLEADNETSILTV